MSRAMRVYYCATILDVDSTCNFCSPPLVLIRVLLLFVSGQQPTHSAAQAEDYKHLNTHYIESQSSFIQLLDVRQIISASYSTRYYKHILIRYIKTNYKHIPSARLETCQTAKKEAFPLQPQTGKVTPLSLIPSNQSQQENFVQDEVYCATQVPLPPLQAAGGDPRRLDPRPHVFLLARH